MRGTIWLIHDDGATRLSSGDAAVVRGSMAHRVADQPDRPPQIRIRHAQHCVGVADEHPIVDTPLIAPRTYGLSENSPLALITAAYRNVDDVGRRLFSALPALITFPAGAAGIETTTALLAEEMRTDRPGQELVLDRLVDLILVRALTTWFTQPEIPPAWYRALGDPVAGPALRAMRAAPAHPWLVSELAARSGVSRAVFARRFTSAVGTAPLTYLTTWRMELAAELLRESDDTIASVAHRVGYTDSFAFSTAFKRHRGITPSHARAK